jgi:hypothetical protein
VYRLFCADHRLLFHPHREEFTFYRNNSLNLHSLSDLYLSVYLYCTVTLKFVLYVFIVLNLVLYPAVIVNLVMNYETCDVFSYVYATGTVFVITYYEMKLVM